VRVEPVAQVLHHTVADDVRQVGLTDAEHARHDRDRDHHADEQVQEAEVRPSRGEQRVVEHDLNQEWVHDAQPRRDENRNENQRRTAPVGAKQAHDPPDEACAWFLAVAQRERR